jgi:hypothetical protein
MKPDGGMEVWFPVFLTYSLFGVPGFAFRERCPAPTSIYRMFGEPRISVNTVEGSRILCPRRE